MTFAEFVSAVENETSEDYETFMREYNDSCIRTGNTDAHDNAEYFCKENNISLDDVGVVESELKKLMEE